MRRHDASWWASGRAHWLPLADEADVLRVDRLLADFGRAGFTLLVGARFRRRLCEIAGELETRPRTPAPRPLDLVGEQTIRVDIDRAARSACDEVLEELAARGVDLESATLTLEKIKVAVSFELIARARSLIAAAKVPAALEVVERFEAENQPFDRVLGASRVRRND